ncbi:MAG: hypothetical protein AAF092_02940 [Pseudomonadota bacterium]
MQKVFNHFCRDEHGAVTVDWVVLTSATVGLGVVVLTTVSGGISDLASAVDGELSAMTIAEY